MLWLAAYLTGFPPVGLHALSWTHGLARNVHWSKDLPKECYRTNNPEKDEESFDHSENI